MPTTCFLHSNRNMYNPAHARDTVKHKLCSGHGCSSRPAQQEDRKVKSPQSEESKPPVKTEQRGRILGIGGVFFKSVNRDHMREWYSKHLGLADKGQGVMLPWREHDDPQKKHVTVWTIFPASTKYFDPSPAPF